MKGGSIASDAVTSLVTPKTFDRMSAMFTNHAGGCARCGASQKHKGGNRFASMMGSHTLEAFSGNVRNTGLVSGDQVLPPGLNTFKQGELRPANVKAVNAKATNAKANTKAANVKANVKAANTKAANVKPANTSSVNSSRPANVNARLNTKAGGMPSISQMLGMDNKKMNVRHSSMMGGNNQIGPTLNIRNVAHSARQVTSDSASTRLLANEAISGPQLMNKQVQYGSTSDLRNQPFGFGAAAATGGAKTLKVKTLQKLKELKKKQQPCKVKKITK